MPVPIWQSWSPYRNVRMRAICGRNAGGPRWRIVAGAVAVQGLLPGNPQAEDILQDLLVKAVDAIRGTE
jgi:hypothetical protein